MVTIHSPFLCAGNRQFERRLQCKTAILRRLVSDVFMCATTGHEACRRTPCSLSLLSFRHREKDVLFLYPAPGNPGLLTRKPEIFFNLSSIQNLKPDLLSEDVFRMTRIFVVVKKFFCEKARWKRGFGNLWINQKWWFRVVLKAAHLMSREQSTAFQQAKKMKYFSETGFSCGEKRGG